MILCTPQLSSASTSSFSSGGILVSPLKLMFWLKHSIEGGVLSTMVNKKLQELDNPFKSVIFKVTMLLPDAETYVPVSGIWLTSKTPQLSSDVARPV